MAITLPQGFNITSKQPIDTRILLTKAEMLAINDALMPVKYFAVCKDDGKLYIYEKSNEIDPEIGKFRLYKADISPEALSHDLPNALKLALQNQDLKNSGLSVDENGNIAVQLNDEHLAIIDNKIDLALELIQAVESV